MLPHPDRPRSYGVLSHREDHRLGRKILRGRDTGWSVAIMSAECRSPPASCRWTSGLASDPCGRGQEARRRGNKLQAFTVMGEWMRNKQRQANSFDFLGPVTAIEFQEEKNRKNKSNKQPSFFLRLFLWNILCGNTPY